MSNMKKSKSRVDSVYCRYIKRMLDIICSLLAMFIISAPLLIIVVLVRIKMGSPVLFAQERIGRNEKPFVMYKFRSMSNTRDKDGNLLPDIQRIGSFGTFLRSSSIDELPALINILKGDMSLVGPRPLPTVYLPCFLESERKRHTIRGGLSGLAQVSGRNALSWEQKFDYDNQYVDSISFLFDIKIILITIKKVFQHADIGLRGVTGSEDFNTYRARQMEITK